MQQIIATGKSILYSAKFHKVLQMLLIIKYTVLHLYNNIQYM